MTWQPIETAPKDKLVLLSNGVWVNTGQWVDNLNGSDDAGWTCWEIASWGYEEYAHIVPTHWMPLPPPPSP